MPPPAVLILIHRSLGALTALLASLGVATAIDFNHTITLGSVLLAFVIIAIAGVFTIRSKIAAIWREEAEGERASKERLEELLSKERADRSLEEREQQELRHELKNEIASCKAQLKVMEARTDLTAALEAIRVMNADLASTVSHEILTLMRHAGHLSEERDQRTHHLLAEIRDKLPTEPFSVHEVRHEGGET